MPEASTSSQTIPSRRPGPVEVIDVDAIPDDDARPAQRRRMNTGLPQAVPPVAGPSRQDPIVIFDSDEEVERGLFADTPPRRRHLPANVRRLERLPSHRDILRPQRYSPPPAIIPNAQPFGFEAMLNRPPRRSAAPVPAPAPQAAPRSHHQPAMGLGGGMIAMNRQAAAEDAYRRRHHPPPLPQTRRTTFYGNEQPSQRTTGFAGSVVNVLRNLFGHSGHQHQEEDRTWISYFDDPWGHEEAELGRGWDIPAEGGIAMPPPPFPKPKATTYEQSYTHPGSPPPGFTWDFADSDVSGNTAAQSSKKVIVLDEEGAVASSSSQSAPQTTATLVCARCMDPLVLPAQAASTEENKERRVWSLRCGHMFDGKCITNLMRPYAEPAEAKMEVDAGETLDAKLVPIVDRKGKGKATDHLAPSTILPHEEDGSIRSRLRPRRVVGFSHDPGVAVQSPSQLPEEVEASSSSRTLRPSSKRARGSIAEVPGATVKGKGRKSRRQRYTWKCPVPDCGLEHVSVLPAGEVEWLMDPHKGAIPLFV